jgi:hypothetical protein
VLHMDVVKVDRDVAHVGIVSDECCKHLFKIFQLFQIYVACVLIWMLHMFHAYVARVCSNCFIYFSLMLQQVFSYCKLQVFYLDVAYVAVAIQVWCKSMF